LFGSPAKTIAKSAEIYLQKPPEMTHQENEIVCKKKVYICFDYDQDKALKDLLIAQSNNKQSPFEIVDGSLQEAAPEKGWAEKARERIGKAEVVIVILGHLTHKAPGVLKEIKIARKLGKKVVQIVGYKDHRFTRVPLGGVLYSWTWDNLKKILTRNRQGHRKTRGADRNPRKRVSWHAG
jgi:hypothetical protein